MKTHVSYKRHGQQWTVTEKDYDGHVVREVVVEAQTKKDAEVAYARVTLQDHYSK